MQMNLEELYRRYKVASSYGNLDLGAMSALYTYILPDRRKHSFNYGSSNLIGVSFYGNCYDDTAIIAARHRANDLHGVLIPEGKDWGKITLDPIKFKNYKEIEDVNELKENKQFNVSLDKINDLLHKYLSNSNLSRAVSASNLDLIAGTGAIWVESESDDNPINFQSIPIDTLTLEYANDDVINTCWFKRKMSCRFILEEYPSYSDRSYLKDNINKEVEVLFGQIKFVDKKDKRVKYYIYAVLERNPEELLYDVIRNYKQIIIYRDTIIPGGVHGFGIGMMKLPSVWRLNHLLASYHENLALLSNPPMYVDNDLAHNPSVSGNLMRTVIPTNPSNRRPIEIMQVPVSTLPMHEIDSIRLGIQRDFQVNILGDVGGPIPSATEVAYREELAQRRTTTDISRLINELPKQIYEISFSILNERGFFNGLMSKKLLNGINFFVNPLQELQNKANVANILATSQALIQTDGKQLETAIINPEKKGRYIAKMNGVPSEVLNSPEESQAIIANIVQQAQKSENRLFQSATTTNIPLSAEDIVPGAY